MGAAITHATASRITEEAADLNIGAAISMHPGPLDPKPSQVPHLYLGGTKDNWTQVRANIPAVYELSTQPKAYANGKGLTHNSQTGKWDKFVSAMFDCHLKGKSDSCELIYGRGKSTLCGGGTPFTMETCKTANFNGYDEVSVSEDEDSAEDDRMVRKSKGKKARKGRKGRKGRGSRRGRKGRWSRRGRKGRWSRRGRKGRGSRRGRKGRKANKLFKIDP